MRYVSTFSGIEAASVAWEPLGWEPMAFAEDDPFPSAVLAHRYPDVPNLGDVTKVDWKEFVNEHGRPDVLVGGSPCQSFSVAGGRASLAGQSSLMYEYIRACAELRSPWIVWENVPGVFSVRDNAFAQLLCSLQDIGYVSLAWRVLDAQFIRVPVRDDRGGIAGWVGPVAQRRRRVFLVGRLGDGGGAAAVLFESESVRGNTETSREKREALAKDARGSSEGTGEGCLTPWDAQSRRVYGDSGVYPTLDARDGKAGSDMRAVLQKTYAFKYSAGAKAGTMPTYDDGSCNTLTADWHAPAVAFAQNTRNEVRLMQGDGSVVGALGATGSSKGQGIPFVAAPTFVCNSNDQDVVGTLCACDHKGVGEQYLRDGKVVVMAHGHYNAECEEGGLAPTLTAHAMKEAPIVAHPEDGELICMASPQGGAEILDDCSPTITSYAKDHAPMVTGRGFVLRRLTPTECERLQGFPDGWTDVPYRGKDHPSDGARYKAIGNSMAVPVMMWIGKRIETVHSLLADEKRPE